MYILEALVAELVSFPIELSFRDTLELLASFAIELLIIAFRSDDFRNS